MLQIEHKPKLLTWSITGAKLYCGCGLWQLYAYRDMAHKFAREHSNATHHMSFVQDIKLELDSFDYVYPDGTLEMHDAS